MFSHLKARPHRNHPRMKTCEPSVHSWPRKITQPSQRVTAITHSISYILIGFVYMLTESLCYRIFLAKQYHYSQKVLEKGNDFGLCKEAQAQIALLTHNV